jgi:hypothetical protein
VTERPWTIIRLTLGVMQMTAAAVALGLLVAGGVTALALILVVLTCLLTTISVVLFGTRPADATPADVTPPPRA